MAMKVLKIAPGQKPEVIEIEQTYKALCNEVQGLIEVVYPFEDLVALICNEEGHVPPLFCKNDIVLPIGQFRRRLLERKHGAVIGLTVRRMRDRIFPQGSNRLFQADPQGQDVIVDLP